MDKKSTPLLIIGVIMATIAILIIARLIKKYETDYTTVTLPSNQSAEVSKPQEQQVQEKGETEHEFPAAPGEPLLQ